MIIFSLFLLILRREEMWEYKGSTKNEKQISLHFKTLFCYRKYGIVLSSINHLKFCFAGGGQRGKGGDESRNVYEGHMHKDKGVED